MTTCCVEGGNHHIKGSASDSKHVGQSWYDHGICSCCGIEFFPEKAYYSSYVCTKLIVKELRLYADINDKAKRMEILNRR